jgi:type I restriction enzyme S subunit
MVNMGELFASSRLRNATMDRVPLEGRERLRFLLHSGDLLFARQSLVLAGAGKCSVFLGDTEPVTFESHVIRVRLEPLVADPLFYYYFFQSRAGHAVIESIVEQGAGASGIRASDLARVTVPHPPIESQRRIAGILSALDDKIELNRRKAETLEATARALFRSWFVEFDPVRAKAVGRNTGLAPNVRDLFPDRLVESELGEIPEGWATAGIYDIADVVYGAPFSSARFNDQRLGRPLIRIRDLVDQEPAVWTTEEPSRGYVVHGGDIIVGMDGEFRAYLWHGLDAWLNQRVCVFRPKPGVPAAFVRGSIEDPLAGVEASETATTVIHLGKADIDTFRIVLPSGPVLARFRAIAEPVYEQVVAARREAKHLATVRDSLLPRLLNGWGTAGADA